MKCPVCKTECFESKCPVCGFGEVGREFINKEDAYKWEIDVLLPFKIRYHDVVESKKALKISGNKLIKYDKSYKLESVIVPDGITEISEKAFDGCETIRSIYLPDSVSTIGDYCFAGCHALRYIHLSDNIEYIPRGAFIACGNLKNINLPQNLRFIGKSAFVMCHSLNTLIVPNNVIEICDEAFMGSGLTEIVLSSKLRLLGYSVFDNCYQLKTIMVPADNENFKSIDNCLIKLSLGGLLIKAGIESDIPDTELITLLSNRCFSSSRKEELLIPQGITSIGYGVFDSCNEMRWFHVDSNNSRYYSQNNCIVDTEKNEIIAGIANCVIPCDSDVYRIAFNAFLNLKSKTSVVIPENITNIDDRAFESCEFDIYCEAFEKPKGWHGRWCHSHKGNIYWGSQWSYDDKGNPILN